MGEELSKDYILLKEKINLASLHETINSIEAKNYDLSFAIYHTIPDEIINDYVEFGIESEKNTRGLLKPGEESKLSVQSIKTQYNLRLPDKFFFDVLIFNKVDNKIVGRLNSWGFKSGGTYYIFHMFVKESFRKRNLGKLLILKTIKTAIDNIPNVTKFELFTHESNLPAQKIIKEIGFTLK